MEKLALTCTNTTNVTNNMTVASLNCLSNLPSMATVDQSYTSSGQYISYTGGNGVAYPAQTISSTGALGLTMTIAAGTLSSGSGGTLAVSISGTPTTFGTGYATFAVNFGGKTCNFTVPVQELILVTSRTATNYYPDESSGVIDYPIVTIDKYNKWTNNHTYTAPATGNYKIILSQNMVGNHAPGVGSFGVFLSSIGGGTNAGGPYLISVTGNVAITANNSINSVWISCTGCFGANPAKYEASSGSVQIYRVP